MKAPEIRRIGVISAGLMGHGIAREFVLAGYERTRTRWTSWSGTASAAAGVFEIWALQDGT
jgi:hypothetical protein